MIVMPLGTGSATPTADRHLASVALWREGRVFLFDCGENAQMRMLQAGMKRSKIDYIFITHLDGDHFFGLPGLITTMQLQRREKPLHIVSPEGLQAFVEAAIDAVKLELGFDLIFHEIPVGTDHMVVVEEEDFTVEVRKLEHPTYCVGYRFEERGKPGKVNADRAAELGITEDQQFKDLKAGQSVTLADGTTVHPDEIVGQPVRGHVFAYVTDTRFCENAVRLAENATILYHEATFGQNLKDKAVDTGHSTAQEAGIVAKTAGVERLVIGHFSARYTNAFVLLKEAKSVFDNTWVATELRPIMTDPAQEHDIFKPYQPDQGKRGFGNRPPQRGGQRPGGYRPQGGGGGGYRPQGNRPYNSEGPRYNDRGDRPQRPYNPDYNRDRGYDRGPRQFDRQDRPARPFNPDYNRDRPARTFNPDFDRQDRPARPFNPDYNRGPRQFDRTERPPRREFPDTRPPRREFPDSRPPRQVEDNRPITPRNPFDEFDRF